jgi:hypothetical protein
MQQEAKSEDVDRLCQAVSPDDEPVIILRPCIARNAAGGFAMLMPKTKSGIRACCRLVTRAARFS